jgi:hypothetical protein
MIAFIVLVIMLTGCTSETTASKEEIDKFIADTKEMTALFEEVYNTQREFTTDEEREFNYYDVNYGKDSGFKGTPVTDTDIRLISTYTGLLYYDAKRMEGVEDSFARDLKTINESIADLEEKLSE